MISQRPEIFWGFVASMYIGNFLLLILNLPLVGPDPSPLVVALVLGPMMEKTLRQSLFLTRGSVVELVSRPLTAVILLLALWPRWWDRRSYGWYAGARARPRRRGAPSVWVEERLGLPGRFRALGSRSGSALPGRFRALGGYGGPFRGPPFQAGRRSFQGCAASSCAPS